MPAMANRSSDSRCWPTIIGSYSRNLLLWFWCILMCFCGLPRVDSYCLGVDIKVATYPEGTIAVRYGEPLEIFCVTETYSADDLQFALLDTNLESEKLNDTTRRLYIENPEKQLQTYYCRNNKTKKTCLNRVVVDSPPVNVNDFKCISKNLEVLNCSWTHPDTYSVLDNTLTFAVHGKLVAPACEAQRKGYSKTYYCTWNIASTPRYRQHEITLDFYLRSCNIFGCNKQHFIQDHFSIVKPDPPLNLNVVKVEPHSVVLKWDIPNNIVDLLSCGVEHIIEYRVAKIPNTTYFLRVDPPSLPSKNETYVFQLTDLPYANMQYVVRICIKSKKSVEPEFWSDFRDTVFYTASERPQRPPDMIPGAFERAVWEAKQMIYVYWKQLEQYEEAGENFTYKIIVSQGNKTLPTIFPDMNKSMSYVVFEDESSEDLVVTVWSLNVNGSSINSSQLYIPAEIDTLSLRPTSFIQVLHDNGTYELTLIGIENINNYTLFWCPHNITGVCSDRMDFVVLDPENNVYFIDLPKEYRYQFAISANNGTKSSGMVWANSGRAKKEFVKYKFPSELKYTKTKIVAT